MGPQKVRGHLRNVRTAGAEVAVPKLQNPDSAIGEHAFLVFEYAILPARTGVTVVDQQDGIYAHALFGKVRLRRRLERVAV
jgi:hypothetical protein